MRPTPGDVCFGVAGANSADEFVATPMADSFVSLRGVAETLASNVSLFLPREAFSVFWNACSGDANTIDISGGTFFAGPFGCPFGRLCVSNS
jgi:hypothetical protein